MKKIKIIKGKNVGKLSLKATMLTMEVGEEMSLSSRCYDYDYVRTKASLVGRQNRMSFSTSHTVEMGNVIRIKRVK